jgi:hypothetical protein
VAAVQTLAFKPNASYMKLLRPAILYGNESWALTKSEENKLKIFERKIHGPISENGNWRSRYNHELYQLQEDSEIITLIKAGRLRWLGHLSRPMKQTHAGK